MAPNTAELNFPEGTSKKTNVLCLNQKELFLIAAGTSFKLNEAFVGIERRFFDTPKGELIKKGLFFYEEAQGRKKTYVLLIKNEKILFSSLPDEFRKDFYAYLEITGKRRRGRIKLQSGASVPVDYLFDLRAKNPHLKKTISLKSYFEVSAADAASMGQALKDSELTLDEKLGFAGVSQKLELPFVHDAEKSGFSISEDDDCGAALKKLIRKELHKIKGFSHFVKAGLHPEFLHEMRVAIRRLRSYLRIYPTVLGEKRSLSLSVTAASFGIDLGRLRDLNVFADKLGGWLKDTGKEENELVKFTEPFAKQAAEEFDILHRVLNSGKFSSFISRIENLSKDKPVGNIFSREPYVTASVRAMKLYKNEVRKRAKKYFSDPAPFFLHRVRIAFKRFRYLFEALEPFFAEDTRTYRSYRKNLVDIQDALGNYQDIKIAERLIDEALEKTGDKETLVAYGALKQLLRHKLEEEERKFLKVFKDFKKMKEPKIRKGGQK
jgi:CHAD domain-containing protein